MDDIKLALLGDREAAKRLTDTKVFLPCKKCNGADIHFIRMGPNKYQTMCFSCGNVGITKRGKYDARLAWNTRAPILSSEEMEMLHGKENP